MLRLLILVLLAGGALAQGTRFVPHHPIARLAAHDVQAWITAAGAARAGAFVADPELRGALALAWERYLQSQERRLALLRELGRTDRRLLQLHERAELQLHELPWRAVRDIDLCMAAPRPLGDIDTPGAMQALTQPAVTLALSPTDGGAAALAAAYEALLTGLRKAPPSGSRIADEQGDVGTDGLLLAGGGEAIDDLGPQFAAARPRNAWLLRRPGLFLGGLGPPDAGTFAPATVGDPRVLLGFDFANYIRMITGLTGGSGQDALLRAIGIDNSGMLEWRLRFVDDDLQEDIEWAIEGEISGILGALVRGMAPLPAQPLPDGALVQVRCGFDVRALIRAVDEIMALAGHRTLTEERLHEDIERAWTGGAALAITRPRLGAIVPRLFASFGIVDREALDRLLERLGNEPWVEVKTRELAGVECTLLELDGVPPALAPAWCIVDDTLHIAETAGSLRALLQARSENAPGALDVGDAAAPVGPGTALPLFDLRFDAGAIHVALREVWLPLLSASLAFSDAESLLHDDDLPEPDAIAELLGTGRGALRRTNGGLILSNRSALGGPQTVAFLTSFLTTLSGPMLESEWSTNMLASRLGARRLARMHAAVQAYEQREGQLPPDLGTLVAAGDIAATALLVPGDDDAEAVMHDGQQLGRTSFRYYPQPLQFESNGEDVEARFIAIDGGSWQRLIATTDGEVLLRWDEFLTRGIDEFEAAMKKGDDERHDHDK